MSKNKTVRRFADNEAVAKVYNLKGSPRLLNLVAQMIRGLPVQPALSHLRLSKRRAAHDVRKALQSAIANAENNHQLDVDRLYVAEATVGRAFVMKRFHARARGRGARVEKFWSHLRLVVREQNQQKENA